MTKKLAKTLLTANIRGSYCNESRNIWLDATELTPALHCCFWGEIVSDWSNSSVEKWTHYTFELNGREFLITVTTMSGKTRFVSAVFEKKA